MKFFCSLVLFINLSFICYSQDAFEIYQFDMSIENRTVSNPINISDNKGYDNQPFFANDSTIFFAKTRNGQTDIAQYNIKTKVTQWKTDSKDASEYSPILIPNTEEVAAVRLDTTGLQRLYSYGKKEQNTEVILKDLVVGYHAWLNDHELISFVLGNESTLMYHNIETGLQKQVATNVGRSLHKVPNSELMSYTYINQDGVSEVYLLNIEDGLKSYYVCDLPIGIQDHAWLNKDVLIIGSGNTLYTYDTFVDEDWQKFASLKPFGIEGITRLSVSPNEKHLVVVVEE